MNTYLKKNDYILITSIFILLIYFTLFVFRAIDDNRLTSWRWVFNEVEPETVSFIMIIGLVVAYFVSKLKLHKNYVPIFLFGISFIVGVIFWQEPELILDSSRYFTQAKHLKLYGVSFFFNEWGKTINAWTDLPLIPFLYGLIFKFLGETRVYIQVFTTLCFSLTVVLTYLIGRILWDEDTGFFAGLMLLGMPYLLVQVPLMLVDVPTMFFLTLAIFMFIKAINHGGIFIPISSIVLFFAFFSKYSTWLFLSVLGVISLVYPKKFNRACGVLLISGVLICVIVLFKFDVILSQIQLLLSYQAPGLRRWQESFISTFFFQIHPFITILALYSFYVAFKKKDVKFLIISWLILLIVLCQIERARYTIPIFPMFSLMAGYGLSQIKNIEFRRFLPYGIVSASLVVAIFAYLPFVQKISTINLKNAGKYLNSIKEENIEVFTLPYRNSMINPAVFVPMLDIFTQKEIYFQPDNSFSPAVEKINKSSLRFTWEYKNPKYYTVKNNTSAVIVISNELNTTLPECLKNYQFVKAFKIHEGVFRSKIFARIYRPLYGMQ